MCGVTQTHQNCIVKKLRVGYTEYVQNACFLQFGVFLSSCLFSTNNYEMRGIIRSVVVSCRCENKSLMLRKERISNILNWFTITVYLTCNYSNIMSVSGTRILLRRVSVLQEHRWGLYIDISSWRVRRIVKSVY